MRALLGLWLALASLLAVAGVEHASLDEAQLAPSSTRMAVQALLTGGLAHRVEQEAHEQQLKASKFRVIANKRAVNAKDASRAAAQAQAKLARAREAEEDSSSGMLLEVARERAAQTMREAKEAVLKHKLLARLRKMRLGMVKLEQARLSQGRSVEKQLSVAAQHAREGDAAEAKLSSQLEAAKQTEIQNREQVNKQTKIAQHDGEQAAAAAASQDRLADQLQNPKQPKNLAGDVAKSDVWGSAKCAAWIKQDPERCQAPNYRFNCAKTCAGATPIKQLHAEASKKLEKAMTSVQSNVGQLEKAKQAEARSKHALSVETQRKASHTVRENRVKSHVGHLLQQAKSLKSGISEVAGAQARVAALCRLLRHATATVSGSFRASQNKLSADGNMTAAQTVELKALNAGLLMLGHTVGIAHAATSAGLAQRPEQARKAYMTALQDVQAASRSILNQTSSKLLEDAQQVVHQASLSITSLLGSNRPINKDRVQTPEQARQLKLLEETAAKALTKAKTEATAAKQAALYAQQSEKKAVRMKLQTQTVINDKILIDSSREKPPRPKRSSVVKAVEGILSLPS